MRPFLLLSLVALTACYPLDGSWDLTPSEAPYLTSTVTFQFKREPDLSSSSADGQLPLTNQLFIYSCFLAQYTYTLEDDALEVTFVTASLLE